MNPLSGYDIEDLSPGMQAHYEKTISDDDIAMFASASGDHNAVHTDEAFAATTPFKGRIAHGMLTASLISAAMASTLPGPGSIYLGQNLRFRAPVRPGETVQVTVTVTDVVPEKRRVILTTVCRVGERVVIEGEATVMATARADTPMRLG